MELLIGYICLWIFLYLTIQLFTCLFFMYTNVYIEYVHRKAPNVRVINSRFHWFSLLNAFYFLKMVFLRLWLNCQLMLKHTVLELRVDGGWLTRTEHNWIITVFSACDTGLSKWQEISIKHSNRSEQSKDCRPPDKMLAAPQKPHHKVEGI